MNCVSAEFCGNTIEKKGPISTRGSYLDAFDILHNDGMLLVEHSGFPSNRLDLAKDALMTGHCRYLRTNASVSHGRIEPLARFLNDAEYSAIRNRSPVALRFEEILCRDR